MKKILIVLTILATTSWFASSQTLSVDKTCLVPCSSLRNALLSKVDLDFYVNQNEILEKEIKLLNEKNSGLYKIIMDYDKILSEKDSVIENKTYIIIKNNEHIETLESEYLSIANKYNKLNNKNKDLKTYTIIGVLVAVTAFIVK